jgi:hypothetical protein
MIENKDLDPVVISAQPGYLVSNIEEGTFLWEPVVAWIVRPVLASSDDDVGSRPLIPITLTGTGPMRRSSGEREYIKHPDGTITDMEDLVDFKNEAEALASHANRLAEEGSDEAGPPL